MSEGAHRERISFQRLFRTGEKRVLKDWNKGELPAAREYTGGEGAPGTHMYIILEGEVSIWLKSAKLLSLKRGDLIGVTVIVQPHTRMATVLAESTVTLLRFNREDVMNFFKNKPAHLFQQFCVNSLKIVVNMIRKTNQHIAELERLLRGALDSKVRGNEWRLWIY